MYFVRWLLIDKYKIDVVKVEGKIKKYRVIYVQGIFIKIFCLKIKETLNGCIHLIYTCFSRQTKNLYIFNLSFEENFFWKYWNVHGFSTSYFLIEFLCQW